MLAAAMRGVSCIATGYGRTEILHVDHARVPQTGGIDGGSGIGDHAAVAALGDSQPVDGVTGRSGERSVQLFAAGIERYFNFLGDFADGLACARVSLVSSYVHSSSESFGGRRMCNIPLGSTMSVMLPAAMMDVRPGNIEQCLVLGEVVEIAIDRELSNPNNSQ